MDSVSSCSPLKCQEARAVSVGVDSGACVTVMKSDQRPDYPTRSTDHTKTLLALSKSKLLDPRTQITVFKDGSLIRCCVGDVWRNLILVADMVNVGWNGIFSRDEANAIHSETGKAGPIHRG